MVFTRNDVRKEGTYGWYPPQVNIYANPRSKVGYEKECLFKHWKSAYQHVNSTAISLPTSNRRAKSAAATTSVRKLGTTRATSARGSKMELDMTVTGSRPPTQFCFRYNSLQARESPIPTPKLAIHAYPAWKPQPTILGVTDPEQPFIVTATSSQAGLAAAVRPITPAKSPDQTAPPQQQQEQQINKSLATASQKEYNCETQRPCTQRELNSRAHSACIQRQKVQMNRPIRSADCRARNYQQQRIKIPTAAITSEEETTAHPEANQTDDTDLAYNEPEQKTPEQTTPEPIERPPSPARAVSPTYEEQLDQYGWLVQIPGDPLNIKHIPERLPYTIKCKEPKVKATPYKVKVMDGNTFFSNTIPRKPMTFTVHPEWQSETFVARRKELEKQGKKFLTRNFAFVY